MRVFIDANIYLGFIRLSKEKLDYIKIFKKVIESKKYSLIFPKITQDEFFRNIPNVSQKYLIEISNSLPLKPPIAVSIRDKKSREELKDLHKRYLKKVTEIKKDYLESIDKLIQKVIEPLINMAEDIHEDEGIIKKAENRRLRGNPPGSGEHLGDEISWELILDKCVDDKLTIVSNDSHWISPRIEEESKIHPFLEKEWGKNSSKRIEFFDTLGGFVRNLDKKAVSAEDIEKERVDSNILESYISTSPTMFPLSPAGITTVASTASSANSWIVPSAPPSASPSVSPFAPPNICKICGKYFYNHPYSTEFCEICYRGDIG